MEVYYKYITSVFQTQQILILKLFLFLSTYSNLLYLKNMICEKFR